MKNARRLLTSEAAVLFLVAAATLLTSFSLRAQDVSQKTFETAGQAVDALIAANRSNDVAALNQILGADAASLISSGDETQDKNDRANFVTLYDAHHRLVAAGNVAIRTGLWPSHFFPRTKRRWISSYS